MDYDSLLDLVKVRRSIRRFKPDPIPDGHIDKIIEVARWAPSGFNQQPWEFVVIKDKKLKDAVVQIVRPPRSAGASGFSKMEDMCEAWVSYTGNPFLAHHLEMVDRRKKVRNRTLSASIDYNGTVTGGVLHSEVSVILRAKIPTYVDNRQWREKNYARDSQIWSACS